MRAAIGTPVSAPVDGTIEHTAKTAAGGQTMAIRLADGMRIAFAHLSEVLARPGDSVTAGQVVAQTGATGAVTGPHLHVEVRRLQPDGTRGPLIDPAPFLFPSLAMPAAIFVALALVLTA